MKLPKILSIFKLNKLLDSNDSEQKIFQLQKQLREVAEERGKLGISLLNIPYPIVILDPQKNIVLMNKAAEELLGPSQNFYGKTFESLIALKDNLSDLTADIYLSSSTYKRDAITLTVNESEHIVNLFITPLPSLHHMNLGWVVSLHDASKQKEAEQMKLDFVSMAAHELRTPITSIKGYLDVFMKENQGKFSTDHQMLLNQIKSSSVHLSSLVDNLLNITKIERGAFTVNLETVNLTQIAKQIYSELIFRAQSKNQTLTFEEPSVAIPEIQADKIRVGEVVANFTSNAINYTQNGGHIKIWMEYKDDLIIVHVSDNGPGIPKEQIGKLFQKFYRVHGQLTQKTNGTGLGLFISKNIIELHHGKVWVDSIEGKGTTFSFYLPKAQNTQVNLQSQSVADVLEQVQASHTPPQPTS